MHAARHVRPTFFAPIDRSVKATVEGTGIRLVGNAAPSMWRVWLGITWLWFYGPVIIAATTTVCFTVAAVLSA